MADDQKPDETVEGSDEGDQGKQTVTIEQFAELQKKLEAVTAAQSGSDKKVLELTKALETERADKSKTEKTSEERIAALEAETSAAKKEAARERLKGAAREALSEAKVPANATILERLIGDDAEQTKALVDAYIETVKEITAEVNKAHDRAHGRTVDGSKKTRGLTADQFMQLSDEEQRQYSPEEVSKILAGG